LHHLTICIDIKQGTQWILDLHRIDGTTLYSYIDGPNIHVTLVCFAILDNKYKFSWRHSFPQINIPNYLRIVTQWPKGWNLVQFKAHIWRECKLKISTKKCEVNIFQPKQSLNTIFSLYIPKLVIPIVLYSYHFKWKENLDKTKLVEKCLWLLEKKTKKRRREETRHMKQLNIQ
jgi:hypothetical protein